VPGPQFRSYSLTTAELRTWHALARIGTHSTVGRLGATWMLIWVMDLIRENLDDTIKEPPQ